MRSILVICCCLYSGAAFSQDIVIGKKYSIQSSVLNEARELWIYLPSDYNNSKYSKANYPVVYLLDGDANFHSFTGLVQSLSKGPYQVIPQMIVVGILNTDRTRDLTPTAAGRTAYYDNRSQLFKNSGGNAQFIRFIERELKPHIDSTYRTSGYNILTGHSFGGLTAVNIFLNHTQLFNAYIVIDPSLWWDNGVMLKQASEILPVKDFKHTNLFLAMAHKEVIPQDTTTDQQRAIDAFNIQLTENDQKNLRWHFHFYEHEDHGTVPIPAEFDALKFIFENHMVHVKKAVDDPSLVSRQFTTLSNQLGFTFQPSESWLNWMVEYCRSIGRNQQADHFSQMTKNLYPLK